MLTITEIDNKIVPCKRHYDIWYFIPLDSESFDPDKEKLAKEFYKTGWVSIEEARKLVIDNNTLIALDKIQELISN